MGKLINTTTLTVDGVTDVGDWYVAPVPERRRAGAPGTEATVVAQQRSPSAGQR